MIAVDTNILVYGHREDNPWHGRALDCVKKLAEGTETWCIPWPCVHEFLAIITHPRIYDPPTPLEDAFVAIEAIAASPTVQFLGEGPGHIEMLKGICVAGRIAGPMIHDARIAAICLAADVTELFSADKDFGRFPSLRVTNPLI
jgi:toxin-antitoxin system PIN domain toxin